MAALDAKKYNMAKNSFCTNVYLFCATSSKKNYSIGHNKYANSQHDTKKVIESTYKAYWKMVTMVHVCDA